MRSWSCWATPEAIARFLIDDEDADAPSKAENVPRTTMTRITEVTISSIISEPDSSARRRNVPPRSGGQSVQRNRDALRTRIGLGIGRNGAPHELARPDPSGGSTAPAVTALR